MLFCQPFTSAKKLLLCLFRWRLAIGMAKIKDIPHGFIFSLQQCFDLGEEKLIFTTWSLPARPLILQWTLVKRVGYLLYLTCLAMWMRGSPLLWVRPNGHEKIHNQWEIEPEWEPRKMFTLWKDISVERAEQPFLIFLSNMRFGAIRPWSLWNHPKFYAH